MGTVTPDPLRSALRAVWAAAAPSWDEHAAFVDDHGRPVSDAMVRAVALEPGSRVLELAAGPGGVGLDAAGIVGPTGEVVLSDVVGEMVELAASRAKALHLDNVTARVLDLEAIAEPDAAFDAVVCREGLMFAPEPATAVREIARVLRPGGAAAVAVWGPRTDNPWLAALLDALGAELGVDVPPPGIPGPFALDDAARLRELFVAAGFRDVTVDAVAVPWVAADRSEWWRVVPGLAGPVPGILASLTDDARERVRASAEAALAPYVTARGGYEIPGLSLVAAGRR